MKLLKRLSALALTIILAANLTGYNAHAAEPIEKKAVSGSFINPLYEDIFSDSDIQPHKLESAASTASESEEVEYLTNLDDVAAIICEGMVAREAEIPVNFAIEGTGFTDEEIESALIDIFFYAMAHTGNPVEGDYIMWQYGNASYNGALGEYEGYTLFEITYYVEYYTTAEQEAEVDQKVADVLNQLDVFTESDYNQIYSIYEYICDNVVYDHEHVDDETYLTQYTAYGALIDGTSVCQGYAVLFYRLALELGIDARLIPGIGNGGPHGWNIVQLDDLYYNVDSTWDAGQSEYSFFLKNEADFIDHERDEEYNTEEFHEYYPMASESYLYEPLPSGTCGDNLTWELSLNGVLTISGEGEMTSGFENMTEITSVVIGDGVTKILPGAFGGCTYLESFTVDEGNEYYESIDGVIFTEDLSTLVAFPTCKTGAYNVPSGTTTIGEKAFYNRINPGAFVIPASVTTVEDSAFAEFTDAVEKITFKGDVPTFGENVFANTKTTIYYPEEYAGWVDIQESLVSEGTALTWEAYTLTPAAPETPTISSVYSKVQTSAKVTWTASENADGYELWRSTTPEEDSDWGLIKTIADGAKVQYTNQGLTVGQTYYYKVRAYVLDIDGEKVYSEFSNVNYMPAAVVFENVYSNSTNRLRLLWNEISGAHGYQIWRKADDGSWKIIKTIGDKGNELTDSKGSVTAYSNTDLEAGKTYTYKMRAFMITEDGKKVFGAYSDEFSRAVKPETPVVSGTSSKAGRAVLEWDEISDATGYQIWMSTSADGEFSIIKSITDGETTAYTKYDLESGETYYFKVRAYSEANGLKSFGDYSDIVEVTVR